MNALRLAVVTLFVFAVPAAAEPLTVPVGQTITIDVGVPIRSVNAVEGNDRVQLHTARTTHVALTPVRAGRIEVVVRTAEGPARLTVNVPAPKKEELSSAVLEAFLAEHAN